MAQGGEMRDEALPETPREAVCLSVIRYCFSNSSPQAPEASSSQRPSPVPWGLLVFGQSDGEDRSRRFAPSRLLCWSDPAIAALTACVLLQKKLAQMRPFSPRVVWSCLLLCLRQPASVAYNDTRYHDTWVKISKAANIFSARNGKQSAGVLCLEYLR
jgi:hypothetical protein